MDQQLPVVTVILGAGASRDVSYARGGEGCSGGDLGPKMPSPLDNDFFDLLQQLEAQTQAGTTKEAMKRIIDKVLHWSGDPLWQSMEKMFCSLHVSAVLGHKLFAPELKDPAKELVNDFLSSIRALLNEAHGTRACFKHHMILQNLFGEDAVMTFNYDFVVERMFAGPPGRKPINTYPFGEWFYGFCERPKDTPIHIPTLYELHGSVNWELREDEHGEVKDARKSWPSTWGELAREIDYSVTGRLGCDSDANWRAPVLLPYWDKRIEKGLWLKIWKAAAAQLRRTSGLIVWGYLLPTTDLKARELLRLAFEAPEAKLRKVTVIDPSRETQDRWRRMFLSRQFWRFDSYEEFDEYRIQHGANLDAFR